MFFKSFPVVVCGVYLQGQLGGMCLKTPQSQVHPCYPTLDPILYKVVTASIWHYEPTVVADGVGGSKMKLS